MLDLLEQAGIIDLHALTIAILVSSLIVLVAYRRFLLGLIDPLSLYIVVLIADTTLMFAFPREAGIKWAYIGFLFSFWLGFLLRGRISRRHFKPSFSRRSLFELEFILWLLFIVIAIGNLYLGVSAGFPLLSLHPSQAKVETFTGGLGLIRRINMGPYFFFCSGCMIFAIIGHRRLRAIMMLSVATFLVVLGGSKGALLPIIYTMTFLFAHKGVNPSDVRRRSLRKYGIFLLMAGGLVALLITIKDQGSFTGGVFALGLRFLLSADGVLFYYPRRDAVMQLVDPNFWGFLQSLFGDVLGMFRLVEYQPALGSIIIGSDDGFGPNAQYFLQADLFLGPYWGMAYSFLLGYLVARFRTAFFGRPAYSAIGMTLRLMLAFSAFDLAIDPEMYIVIWAVTLMMVLPLWLMARVVWEAAQSQSQVGGPMGMQPKLS